jgi:O-antigen ligase
MRLPRLLLILFAVYFVLVGGGAYYTQIFAVRVLHHVVLTAVLLVWLVVRLRRGRGLPHTPINPWIYGAVGVWLASALLGLDPRVSLETTWFLITNVLIFFALADLFQNGRANWVFEAQFMVGALVVILALYQFASWYFGLGIFPGTDIGWVEVSPIPLKWLNLSMPMGVSTWLAAYTAPLAVFTFGWARSLPQGTANRRAARLALGVLAALLLVVALLTFSRGGFIALGAAGAALLALRVAPHLLAQRRLWLIGLIGAGTAAAVLAVIVLISRNPDRLYGDALRGDLWRSAVSIIRDHPLLGVGVGQFGRAFREYRDPAYVDDRLSSAHNLYLNTTAETGLLGAVVGLGLIAAIVLRWWGRWRKAENDTERLRLEAAGAALIGFAAQSLFDTFTLPALVTLPLLLIAYIVTEPRSRADGVLSPARATHWGFGAVAAVLAAVYGLFFFQWDQAHAAFNRSIASGLTEDARAAVSSDPGLLLYTLQTAYLNAENTPAEALPNYEFAVALEPTWDKGWLNLAAHYLRANNPNAALDALTQGRAINRYNGAALIWAQTAEANRAAPDEEIIQNYVWGMGALPLPLSDYWTATPLRLAALEQHVPNLPLDRQYRVWSVHDPNRAAALVPTSPATASEWWIVGEHGLTVENESVRAVEAFTQAIALDRRNGDYYASRARALLTSDLSAADRDLKFAVLLGTLDEYPNAIRAVLVASTDPNSEMLFGLRASALPPVVIDQNFEGVLYNGRVGSFRLLPEVRPPGPGTSAMQPWYDIAADYERAGQTEDAIRIYRAILDYAPDETLARERLEALT